MAPNLKKPGSRCIVLLGEILYPGEIMLLIDWLDYLSQRNWRVLLGRLCDEALGVRGHVSQPRR